MPRRRPDLTGHRYRQARGTLLRSGTDTCTWHLCPMPGRIIDLTLPGTHKWGPTLDHKIPPEHGGDPWDPANHQLMHNDCNRRKSNKIHRNPPRETRSRQW